MYFNYNSLWKLLIHKNRNKPDLRKMTGISSAPIAKLGKSENVNTDVLLRICNALDYNISDIIEYVPNTGGETTPSESVPKETR